MATFVGNKNLKDEILDLHNGLHQAMEALIHQKNYGRAETILRQIDVRMADLTNTMRVVP